MQPHTPAPGGPPQGGQPGPPFVSQKVMALQQKDFQSLQKRRSPHQTAAQGSRPRLVPPGGGCRCGRPGSYYIRPIDRSNQRRQTRRAGQRDSRKRYRCKACRSTSSPSISTSRARARCCRLCACFCRVHGIPPALRVLRQLRHEGGEGFGLLRSPHQAQHLCAGRWHLPRARTTTAPTITAAVRAPLQRRTYFCRHSAGHAPALALTPERFRRVHRLHWLEFGLRLGRSKKRAAAPAHHARHKTNSQKQRQHRHRASHPRMRSGPRRQSCKVHGVTVAPSLSERQTGGPKVANSHAPKAWGLGYGAARPHVHP